MEHKLDTEIEAIRKRAMALPQGEVSVYEGDALWFVNGRLIGQLGRSEDAINYAAAPDDIRTLLTRLERLEQENRRLRDTLNQIAQMNIYVSKEVSPDKWIGAVSDYFVQMEKLTTTHKTNRE